MPGITLVKKKLQRETSAAFFLANLFIIKKKDGLRL